jgi:hypothetical protein
MNRKNTLFYFTDEQDVHLFITSVRRYLINFPP